MKTDVPAPSPLSSLVLAKSSLTRPAFAGQTPVVNSSKSPGPAGGTWRALGATYRSRKLVIVAANVTIQRSMFYLHRRVC